MSERTVNGVEHNNNQRDDDNIRRVHVLLASAASVPYEGKMPAVDLDSPAILIWLADGITPSDNDFEEPQSWTLKQAIEQAYEASKDHSKQPWIMAEGHIIDKNGITQIMSSLRTRREFDRG
jgi:hypothetical protein